jgi:hypothetical protein
MLAFRTEHERHPGKGQDMKEEAGRRGAHVRALTTDYEKLWRK